MKLLIAGLSLLALLAGPARAELLDVQLREQDGQSELWLSFDGQPTLAEARTGDSGADLRIEGVVSPARMIEVSGQASVGWILVSPDTADGSPGLALSIPGDWTAATAEIYQGGVLITLTGGGSAGAQASWTAEPAPVSSAGRQDPPAGGEVIADRGPGLPEESVDPPGPPVGGAPMPDATVPVPVAGAGDGSAAPRPLIPTQDADCPATGRAVTVSPWDLEALTAHADCLVSAGATDEAIVLYERVLAFEPGQFAAALGLAQIREARGEVREAQVLYRAAAGSAQTDGAALSAQAAAERLAQPE